MFTRSHVLFLDLLNSIADLLILAHGTIGTLSPIPLFASLFRFQILVQLILVHFSVREHAGLRSLLKHTVNIVVDIADVLVLDLFSSFLF